MKKSFSIPKLTALAFLVALSLMIYVLESMLIPLAPIPGIKLGLANVITLIALKRFGFRDAALVLFCRILLSAFFAGGLMSLAYSLAGGFFCLFIMTLSHHLLGRQYLPITSVLGAISHNIAQLLVAFALTRTGGVFAYLPFLMISAILTGAFTGLCAHFTLRSLPGKV